MTADGEDHNRRDKQGHGDGNGTLDGPHGVCVCVCSLYNTCVVRPYCHCVDGPSVSVGLSCGVFLRLPVRPSASVSGNISGKATLLPEKEHGLVPRRLSPSSMKTSPNSLPLQ